MGKMREGIMLSFMPNGKFVTAWRNKRGVLPTWGVKMRW
jgi:hypothetical protein